MTLRHQRSEPPPPELARPLARFELLLNAAIGLLWGPLLFYFFRHVAERGNLPSLIVCGTLTFALGLAGSRVPPNYFHIRSWERLDGGRIYERYFRIRAFKRWMSHGDMMNAWLRRQVPEYRVVRPTRAAAADFARRTEVIERAHLVWFLGALAPMAYALVFGAYGFAALWTLANLVTNVWPILLQRYNRARAQRISFRPT